MEFSTLAKQYGPWSITKADTAKQCSLRFHWKYIEKVKEPAQAMRPEARVGAAAHKAIELVLRGDDMKRAFTVAAVDQKLTTREIEDMMTFQGTIREFIKRVERFKEKRPAKTQFVEHKFGLSVNLKPTTFFGSDVFFRGVWDFGLHLTSGDLVIIDHKTGQPSEDISKYNNQLNLYALAGRIALPSVQGVQSAIHFMRDGTIQWGAHITVEEIDDRITKWFVNYLNSAVEALEKKGTPGWYCGFCGYAGQCSAYKERNS